MIDLHPSISGLPLAGALLLVVSEVMRLFPRAHSSRSTAQVIAVVFCFLTVVGAFLSGYQASSRAGELTGAVEAAMATHHSFGRLLLINSLLLVTFFFLARVATHGRRVLQALYYVSFLIQVAGTVWVGYLGGGLVFQHGLNVAREATHPQ
jgi:uncharacterized membrane protein